MADQRIIDETLDENVVSGDFMTYWKTGSNVQRRASQAAWVGATLTGLGTLITNGKTLTLNDTGIAALLNVAQTFTALHTFSAGINLGHTTLDYYRVLDWTPKTADAASGGNETQPAVSIGWSVRTGGIAIVGGTLLNINTTGLTAGNALHIRPLPYISRNTSNLFMVGVCSVNVAAIAGYCNVSLAANSQALTVIEHTTGSNSANLIVSDYTDDSADVLFAIAYPCQ